MCRKIGRENLEKGQNSWRTFCSDLNQMRKSWMKGISTSIKSDIMLSKALYIFAYRRVRMRTETLLDRCETKKTLDILGLLLVCQFLENKKNAEYVLKCL